MKMGGVVVDVVVDVVDVVDVVVDVVDVVVDVVVVVASGVVVGRVVVVVVVVVASGVVVGVVVVVVDVGAPAPLAPSTVDVGPGWPEPSAAWANDDCRPWVPNVVTTGAMNPAAAIRFRKTRRPFPSLSISSCAMTTLFSRVLSDSKI